MLLSSLLIALAALQGRPADPSIAEFDSRIRAYAALREQQMKGAAELSETSKPGEIAGAEALLATRMIAARRAARRGDLITPAAEAPFRRALNPHMKGEGGQNTRGVIRDEGPPPSIPFVGRHLLLHDTRADLVIDYMLNAIP